LLRGEIMKIRTGGEHKLVQLIPGQSRKDYLESIEISGTNFEAVMHEEGRVVHGTWKYEYVLWDHLGNTRVTFRAEASDAISITYAADYYPYGKILREFNCKQNRYLSTHHERDVATGYDNRGARLYDSEIGRFLGVDPMAGKYKSWSPYNYVVGNPIFYTDPNGEDIRIHYQEEVTDDDGNVTLKDRYVNYTIGMGYTGNSFVDDVIKSLNWLVDKGADVADIIDDIAGNGAADVVIMHPDTPGLPWEARKQRTVFSGSIDGTDNTVSDKVRNGQATVLFSPREGLEYWPGSDPSGMVMMLKGPMGRRSPAEGLLHELGHAQQFYGDPFGHAFNSTQKDKQYSKREERRVIENIENPAAAILRPGLEGNSRPHHGGRYYNVSSPTSIK
jgi:RHS repeat-associated protein